MTDKKRFLVVDHGYFLSLALRLARDGHQVYYYKPWEDALSKIEGAVIGDGYEEIQRIAEPWGVIDAGLVDCAVFPDVHHAEMQLHIEKLGIPVWGSRKADRLELNKIAFKKIQQELGMSVPDFFVTEGLDALRDVCRKEKDLWIKISPQYRGNRETFHHEDYESSLENLDGIGVEFGILQTVIRFLCERSIKSKLEGGLDTYIVDDRHPDVAVQGYEKKDSGYFAAVQDWDDIPEEVRSVTEKLLPLLAKERYRNFHSNEVKITDAGESFLLEPTCRCPSPAGEEQMELYRNLDEIIDGGAQGKMINPELTGQYACEAMIEHNGDEEHPRSLNLQDNQWVKLYNTAQVGNRLWIAPGSSIIGAVVGIGNTPQEALEHLKANAEPLEHEPVTVHVEAIAAILQEIEEAQEQGVHFSDKKLPEPAEAVG